MQLNSNEIEKILPHRYPFLLVDRITDYQRASGPRDTSVFLPMNSSFAGIFLVVT